MRQERSERAREWTIALYKSDQQQQQHTNSAAQMFRKFRGERRQRETCKADFRRQLRGDEKCCGPSSGHTNYGTVWRREVLWTLLWPSQLRHSLETRSAVDPPVAKLITAQFGDEMYCGPDPPVAKLITVQFGDEKCCGPSCGQANYGTVWRREVLWTLQWPN